MLTTNPTIHYILKKRADKKGECPVICVVRHQNSRAERATGVKVSPSQWNPRSERVRSSHPNAKELNLLLNKYVTNMTAASASMAASGEALTPQKVADCMSDVPRSSSGVTVADAYCLYKESRVLAPATVQCYHESLARFRKYQKRDVLLADVNVKLVGGWVQSMLSEGVAGSSVHQYVRNFLAAVRYASRVNGLKVDMDELKEALSKVPRKRKGRTVVMGEADVRRMMEWLSGFIDNELTSRSSPRCCMAIFICSYLLGGVAPTDLATMKAADFIANDKYLTYSGARRKTGIPFHVVVPLDDLTKKVMGAFFRTADRRGGLLFPMIVGGECSKVDLSDKTQIHKAVDRWTSVFGLKYPKAVDELNGTLEDEEKVPVGMTMYSARHSYATNFLRTSGNIAALASMLGRSPSTIATYIATLTKEESLLAERLKMSL